jgi:hypothetical protein
MSEVVLGKGVRIAFTELSGNTAIFEGQRKKKEEGKELTKNLAQNAEDNFAPSISFQMESLVGVELEELRGDKPRKEQTNIKTSFQTEAVEDTEERAKENLPHQGNLGEISFSQSDLSDDGQDEDEEDIEHTLSHRPIPQKKIRSQAEQTLEMEAMEMKKSKSSAGKFKQEESSVSVSKILRAENYKQALEDASGVRQNEAWKKERSQIRRGKAKKQRKLIFVILILLLIFVGLKYLELKGVKIPLPF